MKQSIYKTLAILILTSSVVVGWLWMDFKGFMDNKASLPEDGFYINLVEGDTFASISRRLYKDGVLRSKFYPRLAGKLYTELTLLKKGEYFLESHFTPFDIFKKLTSGDVVVYQIQFIEGWTFKESLKVLAENRNLRQDLHNFKDQHISKKLDIEQLNPEGWFYPDTYNFQKGSSDFEILQIAHKLMQEKLDKHWAERDVGLPYNSPYDVLIMASIIEKETGVAGERDKIAGVFTRRLHKNMRLQTDPTVIYGLGASFDGDLRKRDLQMDTPYNTYRMKGLPPTPIAMPSEASISAAVHPAEGTELYFVAKGDGSHQFSSTLEAHNQAVRKYQLNNKR